MTKLLRIPIRFDLEKETKNKVRFSEAVDEGENEVVGKLYVHKIVWEHLDSPTTIYVEIRTDAASSLRHLGQ